jgi:nicotinamide-nucleotide amidase
LISPAYTKYSNPATTILAAPSDIQIHLRAHAANQEEAERLLAEVGPPIEELLGDRIYSRNGDPLEVVAGCLLRDRGATLSVAESCTGGMLGERITSVAGSSDYFLGGFLVYADQMKIEMLGVEPELLTRHTSVSEEAARAMAEGARSRTGSTYAISVTGEAGPDSATGAAPGTVYIGFAGHGEDVDTKRYHLPGDRTRVRTLAAQYALDFLRRRLQ